MKPPNAPGSLAFLAVASASLALPWVATPAFADGGEIANRYVRTRVEKGR
jgi:hypothetical protein